MRLMVVQNGRMRDKRLIDLRDDYVQRFRRYGSLTVQEATPKHGQSLWPSAARWRVLLDDRGKQFDSPQLAKQIDTWTMQHGPIAFVIGAADGHDEATKAEADVHWSLSGLTLPHQLAHVLVCEQLYRAASILANDPYHHAG